MVEISEDLKNIVSTTIESIKEGLKEEKCGVSGTLKFEVTVAKSTNAQTGFKVFVADASGNYTKDNTSKISFEIAGILSESEKTDLINQIGQLQGKLNENNAQITQLTTRIQKLNTTVEDQATKIKQKDEQCEVLRTQTKQFQEKAVIAEGQKNKALNQISELNSTIKHLQDELNKNPRIIIK
jgi:hypothetical protein